MKTIRTCLAIMAAACTGMGWAAPYIGYVYPAGGRQGTTIRVTVGGQRIGAARITNISGSGVSATFVGYEGARGPLNPAQRDLLKQRIQELVAKRLPAGARPQGAQGQATPPAKAANAPAAADAPMVMLPDLPDLRNLEQLTVPQLRQVADKYLNLQKRAKPPIAEKVTLEITIAPDAAPGDRELRLHSPEGLSNPMIFQVGALPEVREKDRDDAEAPAPPPASAPVVLNGQIMPGEVDRFPLNLRAGQRLLFAVQARRLVPYLADAVPGWAQTVLALYDANGKEVVFADDTGFDPDPSFQYQAPQDGEYVLAMRDALYRGREDFVYRITIREAVPGQSPLPFAELGRVSPKGIPAGVNPQLPFVDSRLPQCAETEPNDTADAAQQLALPQLVKGCVSQPGEADLFRFTGAAGETVVAEIYARRLGSPMDALLRLTDAEGHVIAWNDDCKDETMGLVTHQADAYLSVTLPSDGAYFVQVSDTQQHGGDAYRYYLRVGPPQPDFALRLTPASVNVPMGGKATVTVYAFRKDGWDGDIELALTGAPAGFALEGARIPAGQDHAEVTLTASRRGFGQTVALRLEGHAQIAGATVNRPAVPAERVMQAFANYHLVPAQQLLVTIARRQGAGAKQ